MMKAMAIANEKELTPRFNTIRVDKMAIRIKKLTAKITDNMVKVRSRGF